MIIIIVLSILFLSALALLNYKMDAKKVRPYVTAARTVYLIILFIKYFRELHAVLTSGMLPLPADVIGASIGREFLFLLAVVCLYFFTTDYVQYNKQEPSEETARKTLNHALGVLLFVAAFSLVGLLFIFVYA